MTVAELIRELQAMPNQHAPVRIRVDIAYDIEDTGADSMEADIDRATHEGPYVALEIR